MRVGTIHPEFAGVHVSAPGRLVVSVTDADRVDTILAELSAFTDEYARTRGVKNLQVTTRVVDYGFRELNVWFEAVSQTLLSDADVHWVDLDEKANRVVLGVSALSRGPEYKSRVASWVPADAIDFAHSQGIKSDVADVGSNTDAPLLSGAAVSHQLGHKFQPIPGGVGVTYDSAGSTFPCSYGFNSRHGGASGTLGFITASHCSKRTGIIDSAPLAQIGQSDPAGTESIDRKNACGTNCMWADAAFYTFSSRRSAEFATIAMTTFSSHTNGSKTIGGQTRFDVDGRIQAPLVGELVQKMGNARGWTYGNVTQVGVNTTRDGITIKAQDFADYGRAGGDSGGPVFFIVQSPNVVKMMGIHNGVSTGGDGIFSAMGNIDAQLGAYQFVRPGIDW